MSKVYFLYDKIFISCYGKPKFIFKNKKSENHSYNKSENTTHTIDTKLIEYLWNLPFDYKYKEGCEKYLLRVAFKDIIPDEVLYRKKNPYPKTHHPYFLNEVKKLLKERLKKGNLDEIFNIDEINKLLEDNNDYDIPWFGQLMTKPQLIAYLYQFDLWIEKYNIEIKL